MLVLMMIRVPELGEKGALSHLKVPVIPDAPKGSPNKNSVEGIWALPVRGGSQPLPGWFGATFLGRICLILGGSGPLPGWFGALFSEMKCPRVPV